MVVETVGKTATQSVELMVGLSGKRLAGWKVGMRAVRWVGV